MINLRGDVMFIFIIFNKNPKSLLAQQGWTEPATDTSDYRFVSTACQEEAKGKNASKSPYLNAIGIRFQTDRLAPSES